MCSTWRNPSVTSSPTRALLPSSTALVAIVVPCICSAIASGATPARAHSLYRLGRRAIGLRSKRHYLWRVVDQDGNVLDILVQSRRNARAAKRFFRKLLRGLQCVPRVIVTDKLKSDRAAQRDILPHVEHRQSKCPNNCIEVSYHPPPAF